MDAGEPGAFVTMRLERVTFVIDNMCSFITHLWFAGLVSLEPSGCKCI